LGCIVFESIKKAASFSKNAAFKNKKAAGFKGPAALARLVHKRGAAVPLRTMTTSTLPNALEIDSFLEKDIFPLCFKKVEGTYDEKKILSRFFSDFFRFFGMRNGTFPKKILPPVLPP
jgi:hypothetical protein